MHWTRAPCRSWSARSTPPRRSSTTTAPPTYRTGRVQNILPKNIIRDGSKNRQRHLHFSFEFPLKYWPLCPGGVSRSGIVTSRGCATTWRTRTGKLSLSCHASCHSCHAGAPPWPPTPASCPPPTPTGSPPPGSPSRGRSCRALDW